MGLKSRGLQQGFVANEGLWNRTALHSYWEWTTLCLMDRTSRTPKICVRSPAVHISDGAEHTQLSVSGTQFRDRPAKQRRVFKIVLVVSLPNFAKSVALLAGHIPELQNYTITAANSIIGRIDYRYWSRAGLSIGQSKPVE